MKTSENEHFFQAKEYLMWMVHRDSLYPFFVSSQINKLSWLCWGGRIQKPAVGYRQLYPRIFGSKVKKVGIGDKKVFWTEISSYFMSNWIPLSLQCSYIDSKGTIR